VGDLIDAWMVGYVGEKEHAIVFDPTQVRSPFAKLDPTKASSGDILAGLGAGTLGSGFSTSQDK
jgi:hypothetical protein